MIITGTLRKPLRAGKLGQIEKEGKTDPNQRVRTCLQTPDLELVPSLNPKPLDLRAVQLQPDLELPHPLEEQSGTQILQIPLTLIQMNQIFD
jgi:hypothetical protein